MTPFLSYIQNRLYFLAEDVQYTHSLMKHLIRNYRPTIEEGKILERGATNLDPCNNAPSAFIHTFTPELHYIIFY